MSDLTITATSAAIGIGSAALMGAAAPGSMRSVGGVVAAGVTLGSVAGALAAGMVERHDDGTTSERVGGHLLSPNVAIPGAVGAAITGATVYGTQRMYGGAAPIATLSLGAALIGGAASVAAYNFLSSRGGS